MTRLSGALPEGESNGLPSIDHDLIADPTRPHVAIAIIDTRRITTDIDTGAAEPTIRIRRIEAIDGEDRDLAARMMRRRLEERTGQTVLPMEVESELDALLATVDLDTGELRDDPEGEQ